MDKFKEKMNQHVDVGGIHCLCCNPFHTDRRNNDKKKLERIARRTLKQEDNRSFNNVEET